MNFQNSALLYDELLIDIVMVLEHDWPVGPKFVYAFGSFVEALVLHENIFYDPLNQTIRDDYVRGYGQVPNILKGSGFIQQLMDENLLTIFPEFESLKKHLLESGYTNDDLIWYTELFNSPVSFAIANPYGEKNEISILCDLIKAPTIFKPRSYAHLDSTALHEHYLSEEIQSLISNGFSGNDIEMFNNLGHRCIGYLELANLFKLSLYPTFPAVAYHIAAIGEHNTRTRLIYEHILDELNKLDKQISIKADFSPKPIPPLAQVVFQKCKDSTKNIVFEIASIRKKHSKFRKYLTNYDIEWRNAKTRKERLKLKIEFENSWNLLMKKIQRPQKRWIYNLWDIFKEPQKIHIKVMDKLSEKGKEDSIIEKVHGLHRFWDEMVNSPLPERNFEMLSKLFKNFVKEEVWNLAENLSRRMHRNFIN